jgi:hypothetical protein
LRARGPLVFVFFSFSLMSLLLFLCCLLLVTPLPIVSLITLAPLLLLVVALLWDRVRWVEVRTRARKGVGEGVFLRDGGESDGEGVRVVERVCGRGHEWCEAVWVVVLAGECVPVDVVGGEERVGLDLWQRRAHCRVLAEEVLDKCGGMF